MACAGTPCLAEQCHDVRQIVQCWHNRLNPVSAGQDASLALLVSGGPSPKYERASPITLPGISPGGSHHYYPMREIQRGAPMSGTLR